MRPILNDKGQVIDWETGLSDEDRKRYGLPPKDKQEQEISQAQVQSFSEQDLQELAYNKSSNQAQLDEIERMAGGTGDQIQFHNHELGKL